MKGSNVLSKKKKKKRKNCKITVCMCVYVSVWSVSFLGLLTIWFARWEISAVRLVSHPTERIITLDDRKAYILETTEARASVINQRIRSLKRVSFISTAYILICIFLFILFLFCKKISNNGARFFFFFLVWSSIVTRCKTYRESRYRTAGRGEGVTSRCQTVPWLRDVPKGAHNWFQISQSTVLLISVNGNNGIVHSHTNAQRSPKNTFR